MELMCVCTHYARQIDGYVSIVVLSVITSDGVGLCIVSSTHS